jgi:capsular exopolysaccharide synthesis family protein
VDTFRAPDKVPSEVDALRDEVKQQGLILDKLGGELGDLRLEQSATPRVTLEEEAKVPVNRTMDKQLKFGGVAAFGAFGLGVLGIAFLELRGRRVYASDDVVQGLGMNLVGTLPALPPQARRALPSATGARDLHWQSIMTESVDAIRTLLLHSAQNDSLRVVMVTSALGGEGKTSLASHLAASLARAWRKTLLLDCDLRNPAAHKQFDLPLEPGFSEVLRGEVEFDDVIRPTPVSRLWMIPAGQWDSHAVQALAQEGVANIFERLKEQYDFIVIDACPVLPVADSLLIGQHADAVLFSVLRDVTRTPALYAAHQRLATLGIHMLGAVVIGETGDSFGRPYHYPAQAQS